MTHAKRAADKRTALEVARQCQTEQTPACKLMHAQAPSHHTTTWGKHFEETVHTQNTANSTLSRASEVWAAPTRVHNGTGSNPGTRALPRRTSCHHVSKTHTFLSETRGLGFDSLPHSQFHQSHLNVWTAVKKHHMYIIRGLTCVFLGVFAEFTRAHMGSHGLTAGSQCEPM
jgi:hypothetical protein